MPGFSWPARVDKPQNGVLPQPRSVFPAWPTAVAQEVFVEWKHQNNMSSSSLVCGTTHQDLEGRANAAGLQGQDIPQHTAPWTGRCRRATQGAHDGLLRTPSH